MKMMNIGGGEETASIYFCVLGVGGRAGGMQRVERKNERRRHREPRL